MKLVSAVIVFMFLTGCADTHQFIRQPESQSVKLFPKDSIYVCIPQDGVYGTIVYHGSGQTTSQVVAAAFSRHSSAVTSALTVQPFDEAMSSAKKTASQYLVYLTILHWEDRATEWSARPDRVEVKVALVDVASGKPVTSAIVKGKSGLATFGGDHPQDLLPSPIGEFVATLY